MPRIGPTTFLLIASVAAIIILLLYFKNSDLPPLILRTCLGMQIGGALGKGIREFRRGQSGDADDNAVEAPKRTRRSKKDKT